MYYLKASAEDWGRFHVTTSVLHVVECRYIRLLPKLPSTCMQEDTHFDRSVETSTLVFQISIWVVTSIIAPNGNGSRHDGNSSQTSSRWYGSLISLTIHPQTTIMAGSFLCAIAGHNSNNWNITSLFFGVALTVKRFVGFRGYLSLMWRQLNTCGDP